MITATQPDAHAQQRQMALTDSVAGAVLSLIFLLIFFLVVPAHVDLPDVHEGAALSPAFWPRVVLIFGFLCSLLLTIFSVRVVLRTKGGRTRSASVGGDLRGILLLLCTVGYSLTAEALGLLLASAVFLPLAALLYGERRPLLLLGLCAGTLLGLYVFFVLLAGVPIPAGTLFSA